MILYISALKVPIKAISVTSAGKTKVTLPTGTQKMLEEIFHPDIIKTGWAVEAE